MDTPFTQATIDMARDMTLAMYNQSRDAATPDPEADTVLAGVLAFGSLFMACCIERGLDVDGALMAVTTKIGIAKHKSMMVH